MKKSLKVAVAAMMASVCFAGGMYATNAKNVVAEEIGSFTMENERDGFELTEQAYAADEGFVYTSTVYFEHGQAGALVFGGDETEGSREYWAFNIDRVENSVKLLYFYENADGGISAKELLRDWYIGNDKMTDGEKSLVNPRVAEIDRVQLKVVITVDGEDVYGEFYADNIRRFGVDNEYKLNELDLPENVEYDGGYLGYNCFNAKVRFEDTHHGKSDYTYYTEVYRQQYHYSQYAHWNNDPNGLVYYNGYYHLYYQHHPYSNYWNQMYWGHARSKDLAHWELLPICLFPDPASDGWGPGDGFMWSGSAMVYHPGMSAEIDSRGWFPNGNGEGLIAFYTRDGGMQDQVLMSSDDGGMTWTKRVRIPQELIHSGGRTDCRDPKVFPVEKDADGKVTLWGMALTGMETGSIWFLKSTDLVHWSAAGGFKGFLIDVNRDFRAECPDVVFLTADDGTTHAVMTLTARNYLVGEIRYDGQNIQFIDLKGRDISTLSPEEIPYQKMDYGPDSYATQTFYIDDNSSEYYGKTVSVSWFSGVPGGAASIESGMLADARKTWNGGGVTIPVEWGLVKSGEGYLLSQTPIVKESEAFDKTQIVSVSGRNVDETSENLLKNVDSRTVEISAKIENPNEKNVYFRVQSAGNEYTEIGWTKAEGYYVDRTHTYDAGLSMPPYHVRYTSGATDGKHLQFYILADNGSVEVFCNGGTIPFYVLTFAAPYSVGASFYAAGEVTVEELYVNEIASVWRDAELSEGGDTVLYISHESVELSKQLTTEKEVAVYATTDDEMVWTVEEGEDVVEVIPSTRGAIVKALGVGKATVSVVCGNAKKTVEVTVYDGQLDTDLVFTEKGVISGDWLMTEEGLVGSQTAGDGYLLSETEGSDFTYTAKFDLGDGAAAALIFRAAADMSDYYIANYDKNGKIVKLWTPYGELANVFVGDIDLKNVTLSVTAQGKRIQVALNGTTVADVTDNREDAPTKGLFGLNVCATRAVFSSVGLQQNGYTYASGDLVVVSAVEQGVLAIYNDTLGIVKISKEYYSVEGRNITLSQNYFATLPAAQEYLFTVQGKFSTFTVRVDVTALPSFTVEDLTLQEGLNAVFFVASKTVTDVKVNGNSLDKSLYFVKDGMLTIDASAFIVGENEVELFGDIEAKATVYYGEWAENGKENDKKGGCGSLIGISLLPTLVAIGAMTMRKKRDGNDD